MNILDENIDAPQRERLRAWRIHFRRIGGDLGRAGMKDLDEIIPLLHTLKRPTFFTRDHDFYDPGLRHAEYSLVYLDAAPGEVEDKYGWLTPVEELKAAAQHEPQLA